MGLLEILMLVLVIAWLLGGFVVPIGGSAIHLLIVVVIVLVIVKLARGERL